MKKKLLLIFLIIIIFIGGYFVLNEYKKNNLVNDAQEKEEKYVMNNHESVKSVQVTHDNYIFKTRDTMGIVGHINNNNDLYFYVTLLIDNNKVGEIRTIAEASDFPPEKGEEKEDD